MEKKREKSYSPTGSLNIFLGIPMSYLDKVRKGNQIYFLPVDIWLLNAKKNNYKR